MTDAEEQFDDDAWMAWFESVGRYTDNMPTAMVTAIGRVAMTSARLDSSIQMVVWDLSGIGSQVAARILLPDGAERLIPLALELVPIYFHDDAETGAALTQFFRTLKPLRIERNKVVHGRWHVNNKTCYRFTSRQLRPSKQPLSVAEMEVWTIEQVNALADQIQEQDFRLMDLVAGKLPHTGGFSARDREVDL